MTVCLLYTSLSWEMIQLIMNMTEKLGYAEKAIQNLGLGM